MTLKNMDWTNSLAPAKRSLLEWHLGTKIASNRKIQTIPKRKKFNYIPLYPPEGCNDVGYTRSIGE